MSTIYRYQLDVVNEQEVELPARHRVLAVAPGRSGYYIDLWVQIHESDHYVQQAFRIFGTGHQIVDTGMLDYVDTVVMPDDLVWHVFARVSVPIVP